ncbi:hypothetical protein DUZ99_09790 [Xylanibacillus composti]|uniref:Regulatory protein YycH-like domain-containing protein n=1 Tax=Xylanibacillus composti TaxID=1572762 RepID=A0A8J4H7V7_9BACL|nr:two-component system regulatory protein YycI [Xylanibacillus composti]MDT9725263.1 hypothetical protein [Xylanibacillus composti]GIQ70463.1 hypothetical protein XYCOK13_32870 [Xylanibacillus composti]
MEWGRAKTILILAFLILNLLLGYQLWAQQLDIFGEVDETASVVTETEQLLASRGIQLDTSIPKETPRANEITVRFLIQADPMGRTMISPPIRGLDLFGRTDWQSTLSNYIDHVQEYIPDPIMSRPGVLVLDQVHEGIPLFEVNLSLYDGGGQIESYSQSYVEIESTITEKEQKILPAYRAVEFLAENYLQRGSVITDVRLGYHGQSYNSDIQYMAPKWRVALDNGSIYYIHAINGEVEIP